MTATRIVRRTVPPVPGSLASLAHPVLARIYAARAVSGPDDLDTSLARLAPVEALKGVAEAAALLEEALRQGRRILVVGDFDADGATSTALVVRALRAFGARHVDFLVPDRFRFGYGLTPEIVAEAAAREPDLLVTVDTGISSVAGVEAARARGWRVLITDHHLPGPELPPADAIVNPNQPGCPFPCKNLAGVGVAFYVMLGLRARLRAAGWFTERDMEEPNLARHLDLVALGTVADVVPLEFNNRILVAQGVARLRAGQGCTGIKALLEVAGRRAERLAASDLGFVLAPRLNAAGRLDDMALGIRCLLSDEPAEAAQVAAELDRLNGERRAIETVMKGEADALLGRMRLAADLPQGLCLYQSGWHEGVVGIIASRLKDQLHRPVIVFTDTGDGGTIKGSARSITGIHIRDTLDAVAAHAPGLLLRFGGHAMAAGLALRREDFERFAAAFDREVRARLAQAELQGILLTDGELEPDEMNLALAELLRFAGPWGPGFPEPLFDGLFRIERRRPLGEKHLRFTLRPGTEQRLLEAVAFNAPEAWGALEGAVRVAYRLEVNEYRGERSLQLLIHHMEPAT